MKKTIQITERELEAMLWAIQMAEDSYAGWSAEDKGAETVQDLKALARVEAKLYNASNAKAELMASLGLN